MLFFRNLIQCIYKNIKVLMTFSTSYHDGAKKYGNCWSCKEKIKESKKITITKNKNRKHSSPHQKWIKENKSIDIAHFSQIYHYLY